MNGHPIVRSRRAVVAGAGFAVVVGVVSGIMWAASAPPKVAAVIVVPSGTTAAGSQLPVLEGMGPQPSGGASPSRTAPSPSASDSAAAATRSPVPSGVSVSFHARRTWETGMSADVVITNGGSTRATFTIDFVLDPRVTLDGSAWNAQAAYTTGHLRLTGTVEPGETINAGFNLKRPDSSVPLPQSCTVNGQRCTVVPG
ncbi:MAG TPA: cellulose binding domain-containing protein [Micromonosporaceae bacterium]